MPALPQHCSLSGTSTSVTPGMVGEQGAGLALDPLRMRQVAGVVHRDPERKRAARGPRWKRGEELVDVADLGGRTAARAHRRERGGRSP